MPAVTEAGARRGGASAGVLVRVLAARVVHDVVHQRCTLDDALRELPGVERLAARDRALLQELSYGAVRFYRPLARQVAALLHAGRRSPQPLVMALLVVALYQLGYTRVPPHAVVSTGVEAARQLGHGSAAGFVNGLLREAGRARHSPDPLATARSAHPAWLRRRIEQAWPAQADELMLANVERPPMALRVNRLRLAREAYVGKLAQAGIAADAVPACADAVILALPVPVEVVPGFATGLVSVQDAAAQLAAPWLDPRPGLSVLDACAAPGGKTAHLLELEPRLDPVVAIDIAPQRLARVADTLERLGLRAMLVVADAARLGEWWCGPGFDRILVDAPCSGTGVVRRHPDILHHRRQSDIARQAALQGRVLESLWPLLVPGGKMLYVTCSVLPEENEQVVAGFLARQPQAREESLPAGAGVACRHGRQVLPGTDRMDGFYYARLHKTAA